MKVVFYGEDFKKAVDRVLPVVNKKSVIAILYSVRVEAKEDKVIVSTTDTEGFAEVEINAHVLEPGVCYIMQDDIKKIYTLTNDVTLETVIETNANKVMIHNSKKKSSVSIPSYTDADRMFPEEPDDEVIDSTERELLAAMSDLAPYLSCNDTNKLMTAYLFDGKKNRMVALDGHRVGVKNLPEFFAKECNIIVPRKAYVHLKKIANSKSDNNIKAFANDKYIKFVGKDFTYSSRLIDGEYFKVEQILTDESDTEFSLNPKMLGGICKRIQ